MYVCMYVVLVPVLMRESYSPKHTHESSFLLTDSLTHSLSHLLTYSITHLPTYSLIDLEYNVWVAVQIPIGSAFDIHVREINGSIIAARALSHKQTGMSTQHNPYTHTDIQLGYCYCL